ncbi:MAG TPA: hypothetical protein DCF84_07890 [Bacteroidetes bacterium]|nr:hypothetical protein [Bacteroidota bacterium]
MYRFIYFVDSMKIHATYCSAEKSSAPGEIPAIERYQSRRIHWVNQRALKNGEDFFILSGKHGLIKAEEKITFYDYLLKSDALKEHVQLLSRQLSKLGIQQVTFFARSVYVDPNISPYLKSIEESCRLSQVSLEIIEELFEV